MAVYLPEQAGGIVLAEGSPKLKDCDEGIARWSYDNERSAGLGTDTLPSAQVLYIPIKASSTRCGVLAISPEGKPWELPPDQQQMLDTCVTLVAIALERIHYVTITRDAQVSVESERLRNSLLSAVSHDLRTPLTVVSGLADAMILATPKLAEPHAGLARAIRDEVTRITSMANNLLDMARMQMGKVTLNQEWQTLEEIIGLSLEHCAASLSRHKTMITLPKDLPLVRMDTTLMERVFNNLLENASRYTPAGCTITIVAQIRDPFMEIVVADDGPGLPEGLENKLFEMFRRGKIEMSASGFGLGLTIVRAIIEAHHGTIRAENRPTGGACFTIHLPLGSPPPLLPEE